MTQPPIINQFFILQREEGRGPFRNHFVTSHAPSQNDWEMGLRREEGLKMGKGKSSETLPFLSGASPYVLSESRSRCSWDCREASTAAPSFPSDRALFLDIKAPFESPPPPPSPSADGEDGCCGGWASGLTRDNACYFCQTNLSRFSPFKFQLTHWRWEYYYLCSFVTCWLDFSACSVGALLVLIPCSHLRGKPEVISFHKF